MLVSSQKFFVMRVALARACRCVGNVRARGRASEICVRVVVPISTSCACLTPSRMDALVRARPASEVSKDGKDISGITLAFCDNDSVCLLPMANAIVQPPDDKQEKTSSRKYPGGGAAAAKAKEAAAAAAEGGANAEKADGGAAAVAAK